MKIPTVMFNAPLLAVVIDIIHYVLICFCYLPSLTLQQHKRWSVFLFFFVLEWFEELFLELWQNTEHGAVAAAAPPISLPLTAPAVVSPSLFPLFSPRSHLVFFFELPFALCLPLRFSLGSTFFFFSFILSLICELLIRAEGRWLLVQLWTRALGLDAALIDLILTGARWFKRKGNTNTCKRVFWFIHFGLMIEAAFPSL